MNNFGIIFRLKMSGVGVALVYVKNTQNLRAIHFSNSFCKNTYYCKLFYYFSYKKSNSRQDI